MWTGLPAWGIARVVAPAPHDGNPVLEDDVLGLLGNLTRRFRRRRNELLVARQERQGRFDEGIQPRPRAATRPIRIGDWQCRPGPVIANAARRVDLEDGLSPTFANVMTAHRAVAAFQQREDGVQLVRPRGLRLVEAHVEVDDEPIPASLYDIGVAVHSAKRLLEEGGTPVMVLPKLESFEEAFWYRDVLLEVERLLRIRTGTTRVVVAIETLPAAYELDEILFALRDRAVAAMVGPRDFAASVIRCSRNRDEVHTPVSVEDLTTSLRTVCERRGLAFLGSESPEVTSAPSEASFRDDVQTCVRYLVHWFDGQGTVSIDGTSLVASDVELRQTRLWHQIRHEHPLDDTGRPASAGLLADVLTEVHEQIALPRVEEAARLLRDLVVSPEPAPSFLDLAYPRLVETAA